MQFECLWRIQNYNSIVTGLADEFVSHRIVKQYLKVVKLSYIVVVNNKKENL